MQELTEPKLHSIFHLHKRFLLFFLFIVFLARNREVARRVFNEFSLVIWVWLLLARRAFRRDFFFFFILRRSESSVLSFGSQTTSRWCRNGSCTWNSSRKLFLTIHLFIARTSRAIESERNFSSDIVEHLKMLRGFFHSTAHTHFHQVAVITCRNAWNWQKIRIRIQWKVCCFLRISLSKRKSQRDDKERENSEQST